VANRARGLRDLREDLAAELVAARRKGQGQRKREPRRLRRSHATVTLTA